MQVQAKKLIMLHKIIPFLCLYNMHIENSLSLKKKKRENDNWRLFDIKRVAEMI